MSENKTSSKIITDNRKARHDYFIDETYEAGIEYHDQATTHRSIVCAGSVF